MPSERPYPGQLWKHDSTRVIIVAVHPNTVTYEFLSGGQSVTQSLNRVWFESGSSRWVG